MATDSMSKHAKIRAQQRGISPLIIDWLLLYGAAEFDCRGAEIRYFDHASRRRLGKEFGKPVVDRLGALLDTYAIVGESGAVITTGHRFKRVNRH